MTEYSRTRAAVHPNRPPVSGTQAGMRVIVRRPHQQMVIAIVRHAVLCDAVVRKDLPRGQSAMRLHA